MSSSTLTPAFAVISSYALCSPASLLVLVFPLVVSVVVIAVVRVIGRRGTVSAGSALIAFTFTFAMSLFTLVATLALVVFGLLLLLGCEETSWDGFKKLVRNLVGAVAYGFECQSGHFEWVDLAGLKSGSEQKREIDVEAQRRTGPDWSERTDTGARGLMWDSVEMADR